MHSKNRIIDLHSRILVTGATGFIGRRVVANLLERGYLNVRCLTRPSSDKSRLHRTLPLQTYKTQIEIIEGNLLSQDDCVKIVQDIEVIYHLAAGRGEKSYPGAFLNSVVTTRNLLDACLHNNCTKRFVNVSSFTVYTNCDKARGRCLDELCPVEQQPALRGSPYCYAKVKQEQIIMDYAKRHGLRYVMIRPGVVYGPGNEQIHGRIGIDTFGVFLHLGGSNIIPLSYVDNCAEAILLAGIVDGIDGEVFNVVDDDLPSSRAFLKLYKSRVKHFRSLYVPHFMSYMLCYLWEKYSGWSKGQLPNVFNRREWHAAWKKTHYSNYRIKQRLGWRQKVTTPEALDRYFESCREKVRNA